MIPIIDNKSTMIIAVLLPSFVSGPANKAPNNADRGIIEVRIDI